MSIDYGATGDFMIFYLQSDILDQLITLAFLASSDYDLSFRSAYGRMVTFFWKCAT